MPRRIRSLVRQIHLYTRQVFVFQSDPEFKLRLIHALPVLCLLLLGLAVTIPTSVNAANSDDFVITVQTNNSGSSDAFQFTIPTSIGIYNYNVDCDNNGSNEATAQNGNYTCTYGAPGTYTIRIKDNTGLKTGFPRIDFVNGGDALKLLTIEQWGTGKWTTMTGAFYSCYNLAGQASDSPDLSGVTDMSFMFANAFVFNQSIGNWNTSHVTKMDNMFASASTFNQSIGNWNTANVTDMHAMFANAGAFNQNIGAWNTGSVTDMSKMFQIAVAFNQNIGTWNTTNVLDMSNMFNGAAAFNGTVGTWNTGNVTNMYGMFGGAAVFNQNIGNWNTAKVTDMTWMFFNASAFNGNIGTWNTGSVMDMNHLFSNAGAFNQNIGNWNTANVTNMQEMFAGAGVFNQNIGAWNTAQVTSMNGMFQSANAFNGNIGTWNTANVTDMSMMFLNAFAFNQNLGNWNTAKVTGMSYMFTGDSAFNGTVGTWNTGNVTNMFAMFVGATVFNQNLGAWNVSALTDATGMLDGVTLSTANYDALLDGWDPQNLHSGVTFGAGASKYCDGDAARSHLISSDLWAITDGGLDPLCGITDLQIVNKVKVLNPTSHQYKLRITNLGAYPATSVTVTDKLPKYYTISKAKSSTASCTQSGRKVTCTLAQLDAGSNFLIKIIAAPNAATGKNCARVSTAILDSETANNKACVNVPL